MHQGCRKEGEKAVGCKIKGHAKKEWEKRSFEVPGLSAQPEGGRETERVEEGVERLKSSAPAERAKPSRSLCVR